MPSWRHIVGGTAGVALLGTIGYFGQARVHTAGSADPQKKFVSSKFSKSKPTAAPTYSPDLPPDDSDFKAPDLPKRIKVDISGEVVKPGIYELFEGDRVEDLIKRAGGLKKDADRVAINQALKLKDEQKIVVPAKAAPGKPTAPPQFIQSPSSTNPVAPSTTESSFAKGSPKSNKKQPPSSPISINSATEAQLATIPGIGPSMAKKIVDYRTTNGDFVQLEDLRNIKGMGEKLFAKIHEWITL